VGAQATMSEKTNAVTPDLRKISALFDIRADFVHRIPYGSGHINDTYCASFDQAGLRRVRYILQRINTNVFRTPEQLMENIRKLAAGLGGGRFHETIPDFHNTPKRLEALRAAIEADKMNSAADLKADIDFVLTRAADCSRITDLIATGFISERVTHNDTKLNNVLLDDETAEGVCVIVLDTTMPGSALYDFGDMVRTATPTTREDSTDLSKLDLRLDRFEVLVGGYMTAARSFLNATELENLAFSGKLLTLECGIRFLTDYLEGDVYFKIKHPDHNLDRCRNQFAFVAAIEKRLPDMEKVVASHAE
jgi:hypothetical protein